MKSLSKDDDKDFAKEFWRGLMYATAGATVIAVSLFLIAIVSYFSFKYGW